MAADPYAKLFYGFVIGDAPGWLARNGDGQDNELSLYDPYTRWILARLAEGDTASVPDGDALQAELAGVRAARRQDRDKRATALEQRLTELAQREPCTIVEWTTDYPDHWLVYVRASLQASDAYRTHVVDLGALNSAPTAAWDEALAAFARRLGLPVTNATWQMIGCCHS
jgi:hypothetical protein